MSISPRSGAGGSKDVLNWDSTFSLGLNTAEIPAVYNKKSFKLKLEEWEFVKVSMSGVINVNVISKFKNGTCFLCLIQ